MDLKVFKRKKAKEKGDGLDSELEWTSPTTGIPMEKLQFTPALNAA